MQQNRKIIPPVYFVSALALMAVLHLGAPVDRFIDAPHSFLGLGLLFGGLAMGATASRAFS